jgi:DNA polymerase III subunit epsilon
MIAKWLEGPMLAFDTETTGPEPETARIISASAVTVSAKGILDRRSWLIDPGVDIPAEATAVHGITTERVRKEGKPPGPAIEQIARTLWRAWSAGVPVVAMNARYDLSLLRTETARHGLPPVSIGPVLDPFVIDRAIDKYRKGSRKLVDMARHYGVKLEGAHSSEGDALAAARIIWKMALKCDELRNLSLEEMQDFQATAQAEWAAHYQGWLLEARGIETVIDGRWPC